ncbi:MAG: sulfurtransferase [Nitrospira sp.]|nr:sulfurtransferase [Nitrospira sp.]
MWSTYLIDTETLSLNLGRDDLVIIDVRGEGAYTSHIPGAVHSSWHEYSDPQATAKGLLDPDVARLEKRLQALGINKSSDVVVYSNPFDNWGDEGRMFWMLQYLGHQSVKVLDGGWPKWTAEHRPYEHEPVRPKPGDFTASVRPDVLIDKQELKKVVKTPRRDTVIVDARSVEEYAGKEIDGLPRPGHIPSAVNIPWNGFLRQDGTVKPLSALREMFHAFGMNEQQEVVTYCLGGLRSAWVYFLLKLAGYERVRNYPGSWWEWSRDFAAPAEKDLKLLYQVTGKAEEETS